MKVKTFLISRKSVKGIHFCKYINIPFFNLELIPVLLMVVILLGCEHKVPKLVAGHFVVQKKDRVGLTVKDETLQITSTQFKGFAQCKPYLAWRSQGIKKWTEDFSESIETAKIFDKETKLTCTVGPVVATIVVKQLDDNMLEFSGSIKNRSGKIIEMARFHYLHGNIENEQSNFIGNIPESFRLIRKADTLPAPRMAFEKLWKSMGPDYPMLSNPIHDDANWAVSKDLGIFAEGMNKPGWLMAFTGPGTAYGEVGFKTLENPSPFFAGVLLDNIILEPDSTRVLEKFIIHSGDWQEGMANWVKLTADEFKVKPETKPLVGYCSWYQEWNSITTNSILKANKEVANWPIPPGGRTVQIDDGWAIGAGDWNPNQKFDSIWNSLPKLIAETGSIPGLWLAPTNIHDDQSFIKEHPEMLQKFEKGISPIHFPGRGYFMDNDRPDCKEFVNNFMKSKVAEGWRYFKIDFTYPLSTARIAYNRKKTQFESHRDLYKLLRKSVGPEVLLNSCIGCMDRYPIGSVNIDRISGDIGSDWKWYKAIYAIFFRALVPTVTGGRPMPMFFICGAKIPA